MFKETNRNSKRTEIMEKEFIPYAEALALKELGFDEPCFGRYDGKGKNKGKIWYEMPNSGQDSIPVGDVLAPTFSQAFRFFREKYDLVGWIRRRAGFHKEYSWYISDFNDDDPNEYEFDLHIETYEEAELECLKKLIEIVKNDNIQK